VAQRVVDLLEIVEIEIGQGDGLAGLAGPPQLQLGRFLEVPPVGRRGQRVLTGEAVFMPQRGDQGREQGGMEQEIDQPDRGVPVRDQRMGVYRAGDQVVDQPDRRAEQGNDIAAVSVLQGDQGNGHQKENRERDLVSSDVVGVADDPDKGQRDPQAEPPGEQGQMRHSE